MEVMEEAGLRAPERICKGNEYTGRWGGGMGGG